MDKCTPLIANEQKETVCAEAIPVDSDATDAIADSGRQALGAAPPTTAAHGDFSFTVFRKLTKPDGELKANRTWRGFFDSVVAMPVDAATADKQKLPGWAPTAFANDRRGKKNVEKVFAVVFDFDNCWQELLPDGQEKHCFPDEELATIPKAIAAWPGCLSIVHTSYSHSSDWPRFRMIVPFSRPVSEADYEIIWQWAYDRMGGLELWCDDACKDGSRLWFWPAKKNDNYECQWVDGDYLDVDQVIALAAAAKGCAPCL